VNGTGSSSPARATSEVQEGSAAPRSRGEATLTSLAELTTLKVGGWAREFYAPRDTAELERIVNGLRRRGRVPFLLGKGANTLFPDGEYTRPVVWTRRLAGLEVKGSRLRAEAGVSLGALIGAATRQGLSGLEPFVGIPATLGGAVTMNAGSSVLGFGERVVRLGLLLPGGGSIEERRGSEIEWGYRRAGLEGAVVVWAEIELEPSSSSQSVLEETRRHLSLKSATQPLGDASAGCVFRNPKGGSAGRWIDELGLKGLRFGGAEVSGLHANFIVNPERRARAADVLSLVEEVRRRIEVARGVRMETEIVLA
jgi:UDP-N-acetylmuramate dehydrogenase